MSSLAAGTVVNVFLYLNLCLRFPSPNHDYLIKKRRWFGFGRIHISWDKQKSEKKVTGHVPDVVPMFIFFCMVSLCLMNSDNMQGHERGCGWS